MDGCIKFGSNMQYNEFHTSIFLKTITEIMDSQLVSVGYFVVDVAPTSC